MKISLIYITRKRSHELVYSLASFINNADDNKNIEYLFILDPDDEETVTALEKIVLMAHAQDAELTVFIMDKRYGYAELEQYCNKAGEIFTGECLFLMNDDLVSIEQGWDTKMRNAVKPFQDRPVWMGAASTNEWWKGSLPFTGINRKWYEIVGRVVGTRSWDGYLPIVGAEVGIKPIVLDFKFLHLQRGKGAMEFDSTKTKFIYGLPDDGAGGYPTKNTIKPKYALDHGIGRERITEDVIKLKQWMEANNG